MSRAVARRNPPHLTCGDADGGLRCANPPKNRAHFQISNSGRAPSPALFGRPRAGPRPLASLNAERRPSKVRGWSAEWRSSSALRRARLRGALAIRRSSCGVLRLRATLSAGLLSSPRSAELPAGGRSASGWGPEPPGDPACEADPRAPRSIEPFGSIPGRRRISSAVLPGCSTSGSPHEASPHRAGGKEYRPSAKGLSTTFRAFIPKPICACPGRAAARSVSAVVQR
jgi:hypothetical protein